MKTKSPLSRKLNLILLGSVLTLTVGCVGATSKPPKGGKDLNESVLNSAGSTKLMAEIWVDNWFQMYVNGEKILEDSTPYKTERSFNAERVTFISDLPATFAFEFRDFMENDTGLEYIGSRRQQMGDGGAIIQFKNASTNQTLLTSNASWKCLVIHKAPINESCVREDNPTVGAGACTAKITQAPDGWTQPGFDDSSWANASVHSESAVRPKDGYDQISWNTNAKLIWGPDLQKDNIVLCRATVSP
ncbi:MAG: PEBP family protein [Rhizobiaceae bacterium]|nr:PEBP family protein [Rhizobiaceae bacterium]